MYRRSDPRWNRTLQHITDNIEHANESAQENLYGFTQRYVNPCFASFAQCVNACTAPCLPAHSDRRRHRVRSQGRAELSFDFYDDWEDDETDGLLGWGSDNLDRFLGGASNYGATTTQPGRQTSMNYGQRNRDPRYNNTRRKSTTLPRDSIQDPTIIPSSSYFGFLGRLPWNIGGKGLRYKPSAADLTDHPGTSRRNLAEEQPLLEDSDEGPQSGSEPKGHRRQRSDTHTSGHTTDSLSSRGDIFPSEDELEDAVPLDDEFTISLERRTTGQWNSDSNSSNKTRSNKAKHPTASHKSTRTVSSRSTSESVTSVAEEGVSQQTISSTIEELSAVDELHREEEFLRIEEEMELKRKRSDAQQLAMKRGLTSETHLHTPSTKSSTSRSQSPRPSAQMATVESPYPPLVRTSVSDIAPASDITSLPSFTDPLATISRTSPGHVYESQKSSATHKHEHPQSRCEDVSCLSKSTSGDPSFVPARLPHFGASPD